MAINPLLEEMSARDGMSVLWLGNLSWVLCSAGCFFAFDLDLGLDLRLSEPAVSADELATVLDVLLITHEHDDHFNRRTAATLAARSRCRFVLPESCLDKAAEIGIEESRVSVARPGVSFELEGAAIEPLHALHGHLHGSVYRHANFRDCGYLLSIGGLKFFQPGDTVLLHEHLEIESVDVLFVSPTEHNMKIEQSIRLIDATRPRFIFPQHFGTYRQTGENSYWTKGYPDELLAALPALERPLFHKLEQGDVYRLS
jgi:L-ascorbate 6-phosphate lactonase